MEEPNLFVLQALFLLLVEEGVFLGANGWHPDYDKHLVSPFLLAATPLAPRDN